MGKITEQFMRVVMSIGELENPEEDIKELFEEIDKYKAVGSLGIDWIIATLGPELKKISRSIADGIINSRKESVEKYMQLGFTREEAILFVLNDAATFQENLNEYNRKIRASR